MTETTGRRLSWWGWGWEDEALGGAEVEQLAGVCGTGLASVSDALVDAGTAEG